METVTVNGITMAYEDRGQGDTVVLLHGFCGSSAYWEIVQPLLVQSYRVIIPDLRGHGASGAPIGAYSIDQMADDVLQLLEKLEINKFALLGHSMGGYIALSIAERFPERLSGFGLVHSTAHPDSDEAKEKRLQAVANIAASGITTFVDGLVPGLFAKELRITNEKYVNRAIEIGYGTPPHGASGAALAMRERADRREVLSSTALPVLLVAGENDGVVPKERTFTAEGANITQVVIAGAGHMSMYEAPEKLVEAIAGFLSKI
ncbi:3-oxoadipate enol-lactonase 2 [compost metagenome]